MNKPFDLRLVSQGAPLAPVAPPTSPKGSIYTRDVKNRRRSYPVAIAVASLLMAAVAPGVALADEADDEEEDVAPAPDPGSAGLKKLQDAVAKAQADLVKAQQQKAAAEKAAKDSKNKGKTAKDKNAKKELTVEERAQRGVVVIERGGQAIGLGAVLAGDGRIITALSSLGPGNDLDARFADGSTVKVKVGHHDRMWDLAFLVPQTGRWQEGLTASSRDPVRQDATIRSYSAARGKVNAVPMTLRGYRGLLGGDDKPLERAIELGSRVTPTDLGSPIIDEEGRVVAILGRGCAPTEGRPCTPVAFGIPMTAVKSFLRTVPSTAVAPTPWLGIQGISEAGAFARGVRITVVHPESPAEEAKLKGGERATSDVILAVNGTPVTSPEALADAVKAHAVGEKVPLTLLSDGKYKQVIVHLRAPGSRPAANAKDANPAELPPLQESAPGPHRPLKGFAPRKP